MNTEPQLQPSPKRSLCVGDTYLTAGRTIGEGDISVFAGLVGDFTPIHVDDSFAKTTMHGGRIAHGPHTMAVAIGLFTQLNVLGERVIGLLNLNWDFSGIVKIGDTVRGRVTIDSLRPSSKPRRNVGVFVFEVVNQHDVIIQRGRLTVLLQAD